MFHPWHAFGASGKRNGSEKSTGQPRKWWQNLAIYGNLWQSMAIYGNRKTLPFSHGKIWKRFDSSMGFPPLRQPQAAAFETAAVGAMPMPGIGRVPQQAG